jgi:hypothetical protein
MALVVAGGASGSAWPMVALVGLVGSFMVVLVAAKFSTKSPPGDDLEYSFIFSL